MVEQLVADNRVKHPRDLATREPYLIRPVEKAIEYHRDRPYPFGIPSALPAVTCIGRFSSFSPVRGETDYEGSSLIILWYQEQFALPIAPDVSSHIVPIDWEKYAINECY